jgi:quercetin dioxygenase-like cupin family protein
MLARLALVLTLSACATPAAAPFDGPLPSALCAGWRGEPVCELLNEDARVRVLRCSFAPGVGHEPHYHPPHVGYILEGASIMRTTTATGVVERPLAAGGSWTSDVEVRHEALNIGDQTMRYLIIEKKYADTRAPADIAPGLCPS